jgi:hypothetical protein
MEPTSGELVQVRMPRCGQGQSQSVSHACPSDSDVSRPRDVHHIGAKFAYGSEHPRVMPREQQIESQMQVYIEREWSPI